jgi:hypothetical protein
MSTSSTERIDQLALVWLLVPRKESTVSKFSEQLKHLADAKQLAGECFARLRERGLIQATKRLELTEAGHRRALELLGASGFPRSVKKKLEWAKKVLMLRSIGADVTDVGSAGKESVVAARILARRHKMDRKIASPSEVVAVLARRALGLEELPSFTFRDAFSHVFLTAHSEPQSLRLAERELPEFASLVADAARSSVTGRWHDAVFISHVWSTLRGRGDAGITFERFKRRLVEAYQNDLIELSRADLAEAMPAADVSDSETVHSGARFHFVRVEQLAS